MDWNYLNIGSLIIFILPCVISQVYWNISSVPAIFGQNAVLTCHLKDIFIKSKDCAVRQWSGGPDRRGLVYNGYSSDNTKYEEDVHMGSNEFSLIIKNLTESDVHVNYSCSCGFNTFTKNLSVNENSFQYPPTGVNIIFVLETDLLRVTLDIKKVYPVPNCFLYFGNSLILEIDPAKYKTNGVVYSVTYNASYTLKATDCNKQPEIKCTLRHVAEPFIFKENETYDCLVDKSLSIALKNDTRMLGQSKDSKSIKVVTLEIALLAVAVLVIIFIIVIVYNYTHICQFRRKQSTNKEENQPKENEKFIK